MDTYLWYCIIGIIAYLLFQLIIMRRPKVATPEKFSIGEITLESLRYYCGYDYAKPNLISIQGEVFDVSCTMHRLKGLDNTHQFLLVTGYVHS